MIVYACKWNDPKHRIVSRTRSNFLAGTTNLNNSAKTCEKRNSHRMALLAASADESSPPEYSEAMHRAIVVLHCAHSKRSFQSLKDPWYLAEVELLRPGTRVPSPQMGQRDLLVLHEAFIPRLTAYFVVGLLHALLYCLLVALSHYSSGP